MGRDLHLGTVCIWMVFKTLWLDKVIKGPSAEREHSWFKD